jgi:hypothetical protein
MGGFLNFRVLYFVEYDVEVPQSGLGGALKKFVSPTRN